MIDPTLFYRPREICRETHAPRELVYAALSTGELRAIRRGKRFLVPGGAVLEWLGTQSNGSTEAPS